MGNMETKNSKLFWPATWPKKLDYPNIPGYIFLQQQARNYPDRVFLIVNGKGLTYGQLENLSTRFANTLRGMKTVKGDRVALNLPNSFEFAICYFGILKSGCVFTPLSPMLSTKEAESQLKDSGATILVTMEAFYHGLKDILSNTSVQTTITTPINVSLKEYQCSIPSSECILRSGKTTLQKLIMESSEQFIDPNIKPREDLAHIAYTGGTTGKSKGVMLTHENIISNTLQGSLWSLGASISKTNGDYLIAFPEGVNPSIDRISDGQGEIALMVAPWFHAMGIIGLCNQVFQGNKAIALVMFDPDEYLKAIEKYQVTIISGAPQLFNILLQHPKFKRTDVSSVKLIVSGAAPLPRSLLSKMHEQFSGVTIEGYGLTECTQLAAITSPDRSIYKPGSVGIPVYDTQFKIVDLDTGEILPAKREGEICIRGPQVMKGYWNRPLETDAVLENGWLFTGDIGYMDEWGFYFITDRKKEMIIYKEYNVYPRELEEVLRHHPAVSICAVIGKTDQKAGEIPIAYVELKQGIEIEKEVLLDYVNQQVAYYKKIRGLFFIKEMPISGSGKVLKRVLKEKFKQ